jgi:hypothetical protein
MVELEADHCFYEDSPGFLMTQVDFGNWKIARNSNFPSQQTPPTSQPNLITITSIFPTFMTNKSIIVTNFIAIFRKPLRNLLPIVSKQNIQEKRLIHSFPAGR